MAGVTTTNQTALCLIPPENVWGQIQAIRSLHDKAYPRWMPHINFIYPFVSESSFDSVKKQLEIIVHQQKPFVIQFDQSSFHYFQQKGTGCTYHLRPTITTDVVELQKVIQNQLSNTIKSKRAFEAHLTLGQTTTSEITEQLSEMKAKWTTIEFLVDRVYMISRENHPDNLFTIKNEILLLDRKEDSIPLAISNLAVNYLCIIPPNGLSARLLRLFDHTSFRPSQACRIILGEYENGPVDADLRTKLESTLKFTLDFGPDAMGFDQTTSRVFLKPTNMEPLRQLNILQDGKYDGTLTLGELHKDEFGEVNDRFMQSWTAGANEFVIDRIHLVDTNGRAKFVFRLKNQCIS